MFVLLVFVMISIYFLVLWAEPLLTRFGLLVWMTSLTALALLGIASARQVGLFH